MQMCGLAPARPWSDHRRTPPSSPITRCTRVAFCPGLHRRRYREQTAPSPPRRATAVRLRPAHRPTTSRAGDLIHLDVKDAAISPRQRRLARPRKQLTRLRPAALVRLRARHRRRPPRLAYAEIHPDKKKRHRGCLPSPGHRDQRHLRHYTHPPGPHQRRLVYRASHDFAAVMTATGRPSSARTAPGQRQGRTLQSRPGPSNEPTGQCHHQHPAHQPADALAALLQHQHLHTALGRPAQVTRPSPT